MLTEFVIPFARSGVIKARWGAKTQAYQVLELRIYGTKKAWHKPSGVPLDEFIGSARNRYATFAKRAERALSTTAHRVFVVMPIQGEEFGSQDEQRIWREYDARFEVIESLLGAYDAVAIRIDKEHTLDELVRRIKQEIEHCKFVVADLTDERPSCYYEAGYAEGLSKPVVFVASKESVVTPRSATRIHFDIHRNVNYFVNHEQLRQKLKLALDKNSKTLFGEATSAAKPTSRTPTGRKVRKSRQSTSGIGGRQSHEFNDKERAVLQVLARAGIPMSLADLASAAFPRTRSARANSWVRNSVRRPLRLNLLSKTARGTYSLTKSGRQSLRRSPK